MFDPAAPGGVEEAIKRKLLSGSTTISGEPLHQIREISDLWQNFYRMCIDKAQLPPDRIFIVFEDFVYAPGVNYEGESARISTQIIWGVEGYRRGRADELKLHKRGVLHVPDLYLQMASQAKPYVTSQRLKDWGIWIVGREHERSAWQHVAYWLAQYIRHNR